MTDYQAQVKLLSDGINKSTEPAYFRLYLQAQLCLSQALYDDAIALLSDAVADIQPVKQKYENLSICYSIGGLLATTLDFLGHTDLAEKAYDDIMAINPTGHHIGDYAIFLHRRKRDFEKANSFYLKALELYPNQSSIHTKYAGFLRHVKKDLKNAEKHYKLACTSNPKNADALGSYASYLHGVIGNMEQAEIYYEQAIIADNTHANNLCNYGLFLSEEKKNYIKAEEMYRRVVEVNNNHANTLYNYAVMLDTHCNRKAEAEENYRQCLLIEPRHAYALYNLAVLLEEKYCSSIGTEYPPTLDTTQKQNFEEVRSLFRRAVEVDSNDPTTMADYGRYLLIRMEDIEEAKNTLRKALTIFPRCEIALYYFGIFYHRYEVNPTKAEDYYRKLLAVVKDHVGGCHHLARLLIDKSKQFKTTNSGSSSNNNNSSGQQLQLQQPQPSSSLISPSNVLVSECFEEAMDLYERAVTLSKEPTAILSEYLSAIIKYGTSKQKMRAIAYSEAVVQKISSSGKLFDSHSIANGNLKSVMEMLKSAVATS